MRNRFVMRIKSGEIASVGILKAEFKALAKSHHPDLASPGSGDRQFAALREEYEIALRNFELHRFGFRPPEGREAFEPERLLSSMADLLKRGFPKTARHEKEQQRYDYLRYLARAQANAARSCGGDLFEAFEEELSRLREEEPRRFRQAMGLLEDLIEYSRRPLPGLGTANALGYAALEKEAGPGSPLCPYFELLMGRLQLG